MTANQISYWRYHEDRRHNRASEQELSKHNRATEALSAQQIQLGYAQLAETSRANQANELLTYARNTETERSNRAQEQLKQSQLNESKRVSNANILLQAGKQKLDTAKFELDKVLADNSLTQWSYSNHPLISWGEEIAEGIGKSVPKLFSVFAN